MDFPQWPSAATKPFMWSPAENEVRMQLVVKPKSAVEQANVLAAINHTSVVSWMHTNLYVLDLCGRSNLTKIHTSLSSRSQAMINENYLHKRKWAGEKKRGETELEEAEKWEIDGSRLWGGIEKKVTTWLTIWHPPHPLKTLTCRLYVLKNKPLRMANTFIQGSQMQTSNFASNLLDCCGKESSSFDHRAAACKQGGHAGERKEHLKDEISLTGAKICLVYTQRQKQWANIESALVFTTTTVTQRCEISQKV